MGGNATTVAATSYRKASPHRSPFYVARASKRRWARRTTQCAFFTLGERSAPGVVTLRLADRREYGAPQCALRRPQYDCRDAVRCGVPIRRIGAMRRSDPTLRAIAEEIGERCGLDHCCKKYRFYRPPETNPGCPIKRSSNQEGTRTQRLPA